ncbi:zinc finger CCCH domain-containing protein 13-like isoform X1 [Vespula squamosa]|uniref:Zinc finger CCCH domain-containing protein 13-like isoform X1 n=1 Tax=Vespula squamosa TaxID=30214 RepID=A0ABD1ZYB8_VESSQ
MATGGVSRVRRRHGSFVQWAVRRFRALDVISFSNKEISLDFQDKSKGGTTVQEDRNDLQLVNLSVPLRSAIVKEKEKEKKVDDDEKEEEKEEEEEDEKNEEGMETRENIEIGKRGNFHYEII